jgi:peptide/nickel transport system substrate-binding protein
MPDQTAPFEWTRLSRRDLFARVGSATVGLMVAACAPAPPGPNPTTAPPAAPAQPAATAPPAAAATVAPAATAKPAAEAPKPTSAPAATAPAAAAKPAEPKLGAQLMGKLEGPEILPDAKRPPKLGEAPMLAELVKAGKLPPVEERVPEEPLVIKPVHEIGKYGGTWRRAFVGPGDGENGQRIVAADKLLYLDYTGTKTVPAVARAWKLDDGGRTTTLTLRKGMKWSDGHPFTADDIMFWWEDLYQNKELTPIPSADLTINGKPGTVEKIDQYTVAFKFPDPYPMFIERLSGSSSIGNGHAYQGEAFMGGYAPAHYLKQFHQKYVDKAQLDQLVSDAKVDNWVSLIRARNTWRLNPDLPVLAPWRTVTPINNPTWEMVRNPYFWEVDSDGNQLPYFDKMVMSLAETLEVVNLRAIAGEYDVQERHIDIAKIPVYIENKDKSGYDIHLDPAVHGSDTTLFMNMTYDGDAEIAKWINNRDFRRALSLGIDRDQLNETFWIGLGTPGSPAPAEDSPYSPGPEWRAKWSTLDVAQANKLLDQIGLDKKDSEGYRLRTDKPERLRLDIMTVGGFAVSWTDTCQMITTQWKKIGIQATANEVERSLSQKRIAANDYQVSVASNNGTEEIFVAGNSAIPVATNSQMGPEFGKWFQSGGKAGKEPKDVQVLKVMELSTKAPGLSRDEQIKAGQEIWKIALDEQWCIGTVGLSPALIGVRIVKRNVGNAAARQSNGQNVRAPAISRPETLYFK